MTLANRSLFALGLALAATVVAIAAGGSHAARTPSTQSLAFAKDDGVYIRTGRTVRRIAKRAGAPAWSPDRKRLAFVRLGDIYVMRADGSHQRRLTRGRAADVTPTWSPDGRSIAFASNRGNRPFAIYVMRADGSDVRRLTPSIMQSFSMRPAFSPDGRSLVFAAPSGGSGNELFRIRVADGRGLKRLTAFSRETEPSVAHMPSYSPDGKRIAFVLGRQSGSAVWTISADGTRPRALTRHEGRDHATPHFSPDGRSLVYVTFRPDAPDWTLYDFRLWKVRADGSGRAQLGRGWEPDW